MLLKGRKAGPLMEEGGEEQFLDQIIGKEWLRGKIVGRRGGELTLVDQTRIRTEIVSHNQGSSEGAKMKR